METNLNHRSAQLKYEAQQVIDSLNLFSLWRKTGGDPYLVGALAYDLALSADIDMEIFCDNPTVDQGFKILKTCAHNPGCQATRFSNQMDAPDQGYYWQVRYQQPNGYLWKIDMWSVRLDHPGPTSRDMIVPIRRALSNEKRKTILALKEAIFNNPEITCSSIYLYQAVLADGVQEVQDLLVWLSNHDTSGINDWRKWLR